MLLVWVVFCGGSCGLLIWILVWVGICCLLSLKVIAGDVWLGLMWVLACVGVLVLQVLRVAALTPCGFELCLVMCRLCGACWWFVALVAG